MATTLLRKRKSIFFLLSKTFKYAGFFLSIVILNSFTSCNKVKHITTEEERERQTAIKNKIKCITIYQRTIKAGIPQEEKLSQQIFYDSNGYKYRRIDYSTDGVLICNIKFEYDKAGNLIASTAKSRDSSLLFKEIRNYDSDNNQKELFFYLPDGSYKYRNVAAFDAHGLMTELDWYWPEGLRARNKFKYDGINKTEDVEYAPDGKFNYKWVYKYDKNNNLLSAIQYYPGNQVSGKIEFQYDSNNQLVQQINYLGKDFQNKFTIRYDQRELAIEKAEYTYGNSLTVVYRYHYDFY